MADIIDCEGNIVSPLGSFKKISPVSSASVVQLPVSLCSPPPCTALTTSTTVSYSTRTAFILTSPSPASVISVTSGSPKPPVMGGVRGYEYVSVDDLEMIYVQSIKIKKERDQTKTENEKLKKMLKSLRRKEKTRQLSLAPVQVTTTSNIATHVDSDTTTAVSSVTSSWFTLLLQLRAQSSSELQKARATIATQAKQMVDKKREIKRLTIKVATLTHDNNQAHLALQQNMSVYSSSITGSVFDSTTSDVDPEEGVTTEPAPAQSPRVDLPRKGDDSIQISQMLDTVDRLAKHYSPSHRYHQPNVTNLSQPRSDVIPDSLFNYELAALWMFANVPTEEEIAQYDSNLERELRPPPPIYSPRLKKPVVNWKGLNPGQFRNMPKADSFPVEGCPQNENFYLETVTEGSYPDFRTFFKWKMKRFPFGRKFGFSTNKGIVAVPDMPIYGYRCSEISGDWLIDATMEY